MARIISVTSCPTGIAHSLMAAEALKKTAALMGHDLKVEVHGAEGTSGRISLADIAAADVVLIAADIHVETEPFGDKPILTVSTSHAIRSTQAVIEDALALVPGLATAPEAEPAPAAKGAPAAPPAGQRIVAITACPTGIAHTFMAAEALKTAAASRGGMRSGWRRRAPSGAKSQLTDEEIAAADLVIIAADTHVDDGRFAAKPVYKTSVGAAVKGAADVLDRGKGPGGGRPGCAQDRGRGTGQAAAPAKRRIEGPYKHLLTGVSYMLPIVVAGGLCIALSFVFGIHAFEQKGTLAAALMQIGGGSAFKMMVPILSGYIAYSIADRPGLAPGVIGGISPSTSRQASSAASSPGSSPAIPRSLCGT